MKSRVTRLHCFPVIVLVLAACVSARAQGPDAHEPIRDAPMPAVQPAMTFTPTIASSPSEPGAHKFWDKPNLALFSASAAFSAADFAVTWTNLQNGGRELNPVVRIFGKSAPGLALNFAGETAGVIGVSYFLHKTGHHKLERIVSLANIGASAGAIGYGLAHR
jgi:hypothetical protein